jgi:hypothetical protein
MVATIALVTRTAAPPFAKGISSRCAVKDPVPLYVTVCPAPAGPGPPE